MVSLLNFLFYLSKVRSANVMRWITDLISGGNTSVEQPITCNGAEFHFYSLGGCFTRISLTHAFSDFQVEPCRVTGDSI